MPQVEFFGIPRHRTGVAKTVAAGTTLGEVLRDLAERFPQFASDCLDHKKALLPQVVANLGGDRFVRDPDTPLSEDDTVLFLSADSGG